ncbi:MAG: aminotransferase class I/II-fold pyridoxal phosphate-dependent enzyme [Trueperaceae bacterium]|nr:aminotransferase class I/II-fold pyridoxal phosphate-dependent enzyme [Trueperaceae bacterium]
MRSVQPKATNTAAEGIPSFERGEREVLSLATARPDLDTPAVVKAAVIAAIQIPHTYMTYTASRGLPELRESVALKLGARNGVAYDPESEVLITAGTHEALYVGLQAVVEPGDEVLVLDPSWVAYNGMIGLAGGVARMVTLRDNRLDIDALKRAITPRTRAFVFNNPNNPTGTVFTREELAAVVDLLAAHDILAIVDEIYEEFVYDGRQHVSLASLPGARERVLLINGYSKAYAMTGWRVGYAAGPSWLIDRMLIIHQHLISSPCAFAQKGASVAYLEAAEHVRAMVATYDRRRLLLNEALAAVPKVSYSLPEGACFYFLRVDSGLDSATLAKTIASREGLVLTPGGAFGPSGERHLRFSFAALPEARVGEAVGRLAAALEAIVE